MSLSAVIGASLLLTLSPLPANAGLREQAAVVDLRAALGPEAVVVTDPVQRQAIALRGLAVPLSSPGRDPGDAVVRWCTEHGAVFGLRPGTDELRLRGVEARRDGVQRVTLEQWYRGLPVVGGESRALVNAKGELFGLASGARPDLDLEVDPTVPEAQAIATVASALGVNLAQQPAQARLAIRADDAGDRLAWEISTRGVEGRTVRSWVDARDGHVMVLDDGVSHAAGLVFMTDPRGPLTQVQLPGLGSGASLASGLLRVEDSLYPAATSTAGDYLFGPDDPSFDQVNAYYHVARFLKDVLMGQLGMPPLPESLVVRVQFQTDPFVAFTSGRFIFLGRPITGFVHEVARAADIVIHETTHAVLYANDIQPTSLRREAGALHEGLADYFAAAVTGDPAIGEWLYLPFPNGTTRVDMPLPLWHMSNYDHVGFAGGEAASPWGNGMILSSLLWDLRAEIGVAADSLVVESLDALPSAPQWGHFANAMIIADQAHHGTRFQAALARAFTRRGVRGAIEAGIAVVGPSTITPGQSGQFSATACCGGLPGSYEWRARSWCRGAPCGDFELISREPSLTIAPEADMELRVRAIGPWGDTLESTPHFIGVRIPEVVIEGPRRLPRNTPATWRARISAVGPARVDWTRRYAATVNVIELLGVHDEVQFTPSGPFELFAKLTDGLGRVTSQAVFVQTYVPGTVPASLLALGSTTTLDAAAHNAQSRFDLPRAGHLQAALYDVRGRLRVRLADAQASAGAYFVRWDAAPLESGMYFLQLQVSGVGARTERVAILR